MTLGGVTLLVGGVIGLFLFLFGLRMLVTGKGPASSVRNFRGVRAAALYHLLFGLALIVMVLGQSLLHGPARVATNVLAVVTAGVAVLRYRPRGSKPADDG
jgi:hypothetical protein